LTIDSSKRRTLVDRFRERKVSDRHIQRDTQVKRDGSVYERLSGRRNADRIIAKNVAALSRIFTVHGPVNSIVL
jgi:hypothetical protein